VLTPSTQNVKCETLVCASWNSFICNFGRGPNGLSIDESREYHPSVKRRIAILSQRYQTDLGRVLHGKATGPSKRAERLGKDSIAQGIETLGMADIHGKAMLALIPKHSSLRFRKNALKRAGAFFLEVLKPIEQTRQAMLESADALKRSHDSMRKQAAVLVRANKELRAEVAQRKAAENSLRKSEQSYRRLLEDSRQMQRRLRHLSHQVLQAQEEERKEISRELHDEIVQTLTGINVQLASLKLEAGVTTTSFTKNISHTQRLVEKSVDIVHRFARDLRPTLLDDLGLIPAIHSYLKAYTRRTGLQVSFSTFAGVEQMSNDKRTVLYRVTQAALVNVAQHAKASKVSVAIKSNPGSVLLVIKDNGKSFDSVRVLDSWFNKRLGLIGMRERVEMVGGTFGVLSSPGHGTEISASLPFKKPISHDHHKAH